MSSSGLRNQLDVDKLELSSLVPTPPSPQTVGIHVSDVDDVPGLISQDVGVVGTGAAGHQGSGLAQHWQGQLRFVLVVTRLVVEMTVLVVLDLELELVVPSLLRSLLIPAQYFWPHVSPESLGGAAPDDFYFPVNVFHPPSHPVSQVGCWPKYLLQLPP